MDGGCCLAEKGLLFLHDSEPAVLLNDHVLQVGLHIPLQFAKEMEVAVGTLHGFDSTADLLIVLFLPPLEQGSIQTELRCCLFIILGVRIRCIRIGGEEIVIAVDQELYLLTMAATVLTHWQFVKVSVWLLGTHCSNINLKV